MAYTNNKGLSLLMAAWLGGDTYSHPVPEKYKDSKMISVTTLIKPLRQVLLNMRIAEFNVVTTPQDLYDQLQTTIGSSIHSAIENACKNPQFIETLIQANFPKVVERIKINPVPAELQPTDIPLFLEQRFYKELNGWVISGQLDAILNGQIIDIKTTSVFNYIKGSNIENYKLQASLYKWLVGGLVTKEFFTIQYIFKDFKQADSYQKGYPAHALQESNYPFIPETSLLQRIKSRLASLDYYLTAPLQELPLCSAEELWQREDVFKYYANADSARASKVFTSLLEANQYCADKGKGIVKTIEGKCQACNYCNVRDVCIQYTDLKQQGRII